MSVVSGILNAQAATSAAGMQSDATTAAAGMSLDAVRETNKLQKEMYEQGRADTAPWRTAGSNALTSLVNKVNAGPGEFTASPGYEFRLSEGQKALERSAAAKGNILGGATQKALTRYGQDYATGEYQNFLSNYYNSLTPLQSLAGIGQTTAMQNATQGNQYATNVANNTTSGTNTAANYLVSGVNAGAAGIINQSNAITGAMNSGVNNYLNWKYLNNQANKTVVPSATTNYAAEWSPSMATGWEEYY